MNSAPGSKKTPLARLVPIIHVFRWPLARDVGARHKAGHGASAALRPRHRAAGVGECRRLLLPILRPRRHRPRHLDAVDQDRVDLLVEEAQIITLDLRAFRDRLRSLRPDLVAWRIGNRPFARSLSGSNSEIHPPAFPKADDGHSPHALCRNGGRPEGYDPVRHVERGPPVCHDNARDR